MNQAEIIKLRKGVCIRCDADLDYDQHYGYIHCPKCPFKMGKRDFDVIINNNQ